MIRFALAAALLPAVLAAQLPSVAAALPATVPIHTAPDDPTGGAYGVWAAGHGFKASFHGGFALHLDDAAGRASAALQVASCRVGAVELHDGRRTPTMRWDAARCEYDHGAFVERYDLREHGVEQSFVVARPRTVDGELAVALHVAAPLTPRPNARGGFVLADDAGRARVLGSAPVAIDANGRRRAMRVEADAAAGELRFCCDAAWLASAAWPVTIDPLLQPNPALIVAQRVVDVDVLRDDDETVQNLWVAIVTASASGERDVRVRRFDAGLTNGVDVFVDVTTSWHAEHARLAASGGQRKVVAVFGRDFGASREVRWHLHAKDDAALRTNTNTVPRSAGTHDWRPDVGGTRAFAFGHQLLLVWQRETAPTFAQTTNSRVHGALLDVGSGTNGVLGTTFRLDARDDVDQDAPTVTPEAEGGQAFSWIAAWRARGPSINPFRVHARRVGNDGLFGNRYDAPTGLLLETQSAPRIAGADGRYLLAFGNGGASGGGFIELDAVRLDWPHGAADAVRPHDVFPLEAGSPTNASSTASPTTTSRARTGSSCGAT
jgi:hypothetical protein